jgi:hypothetical protein
MEIDSLKGRVILLPEARMDYWPHQIEIFIEMWNEGKAIGEIAERFWISNYEVALLVMHCEIEGLIKPRKGGLRGSLPRKGKCK